MKKIKYSILIIFCIGLTACIPQLTISKTKVSNLPNSYLQSHDSNSIAKLNWREYFTDPILQSLIDTALKNNQELNIELQEIIIRQNEVRARKGEYLPFASVFAGAGAEKPGEFTRDGAVEENLEIEPNRKFPEPLPDFTLGVAASWEIDAWKKYRNARKSAAMEYLASIEGKNMLVTNLVSEIVLSYYELIGLDIQLEIIAKNIVLQEDALRIVKLQKEAAMATQLAVNRFEALLLNTKSMQYPIKQKIIETENKINQLCGRFPQPIKRNVDQFYTVMRDSIYEGIPSQLLTYRPDVRQASYMVNAAKLNVLSARANFLPNFKITANAGFQAFNPALIFNPHSILYNAAGEMIAPLINRNAIKASYYNANAKQIQALYNYEQTIIKAYVEVHNKLNAIQNYNYNYTLKTQEVDILNHSITIANSLFNSARADYLEVLLTQREALKSKIERVEANMKLIQAKVMIYRNLGGGWR